MALRVGFEPTTCRLTAGCSTTELPKHIYFFILLYYLLAFRLEVFLGFALRPFHGAPICRGCFLHELARLSPKVNHSVEGPPQAGRACLLFSDFLLYREVTLRVPSALVSLTSVFGMGTGVSLLPSSLYSFEPLSHFVQPLHGA